MTRLLSYSINDKATFGVMGTEGVVDLGRRMTGIADLQKLIAADRIEEARSHAGDVGDDPVEEITFERLIPWPKKILCVGVNYGGRAAEYAERADAAYPSVFIRFPDSFTGHQRPLVRPRKARNSTTRASSQW